jgi:TonB family protein
MLKKILAVCGLFTAFAISPNAAGQTTLTAKNSATQPQPASETVESDRTRDGLSGPVRRVRTEVVKLQNESGRITEGKRAVLEVVSYDVKGNKVENQYFPVSGATLTGKEVYKYDDKGNISEMTMLNEDGSLLSKEIYKYEFDFAGNWNKMTSSVAVVDGGRVVFEPTEVTYRSIMYYLDGNMARMMKPTIPATSTAPTSGPPAVESNSAANQTKTAASNHKESVALPSSEISLEKVSAAKTADITSVPSTTDTRSPRVLLDAEPPPTPRPILKPVSGGVLNGSAIALPSPAYPDAARRMRISGTVVVEVVIDESGKVISAKATDGPGTLADAAVQAAIRARFSPTKLSGQPVKVSGVINYKFTLTP